MDKEYVIEVGSTILHQLQKSRNICNWGLKENAVSYAPYYSDGEKLSGSLIFYISTEKYKDMHYVRVIYDEGSDSYTIQILRDNLDNRNLVDFDVIEEINHIYSFGLVKSIEKLI